MNGIDWKMHDSRGIDLLENELINEKKFWGKSISWKAILEILNWKHSNSFIESKTNLLFLAYLYKNNFSKAIT